MGWVEDFGRPTIRLIGVVEVLGVISLIVPVADLRPPLADPARARGSGHGRDRRLPRARPPEEHPPIIGTILLPGPGRSSTPMLRRRILDGRGLSCWAGAVRWC
jgi:hypothetical protein